MLASCRFDSWEKMRLRKIDKLSKSSGEVVKAFTKPF